MVIRIIHDIGRGRQVLLPVYWIVHEAASSGLVCCLDAARSLQLATSQ